MLRTNLLEFLDVDIQLRTEFGFSGRKGSGAFIQLPSLRGLALRSTSIFFTFGL